MDNLEKASGNSVPRVWITLSSEHILVEELGEEDSRVSLSRCWLQAPPKLSEEGHHSNRRKAA